MFTSPAHVAMRGRYHSASHNEMPLTHIICNTDSVSQTAGALRRMPLYVYVGIIVSVRFIEYIIICISDGERVLTPHLCFYVGNIDDTAVLAWNYYVGITVAVSSRSVR